MLLLLTVGMTSARAATNSVTGGIGGIDNGTLSGGDGTGTAQITLNVLDLALVKQARDLEGNVLSDNSDVVSGQEIYFVLYVDNISPFVAKDLRITDQLNESEFAYISNTLETAVVPTGSNDAAIWSGTWDPVSDDLVGPDDTGSILDTGGPPGRDRLTVGSVPGQVNQSLTVPGNSLWAIRFRVRVN
jgi:uncharacterized repeat protein (TIGR01451 family)